MTRPWTLALGCLFAALAIACGALVDIPDRFVASDDAGDAATPQSDTGAVEAGRPTRFVDGPLADFNHDGYADYAGHTLSTGEFRIHYGSDAGAFTEDGGGVACGPGTPPGCDVMVGDFTGDGFADYAEHDPSNGTFEVRENLHDGTFSTATWGSGRTCANPSETCAAFVGDFTGDGFADFADYGVDSGDLTFHENLKDGTFAPHGLTWGGPNATGCHGSCEVLVGGFTGDAYADYAALDRGSGFFYVHANLRDGSFTPPGNNWGVGYACVHDNDAHGLPCDILVGDFNADGYADFVARSTHNGAFEVHLNTKNPTLNSQTVVSNVNDPAAITGQTCIDADCEILGHRIPR